MFYWLSVSLYKHKLIIKDINHHSTQESHISILCGTLYSLLWFQLIFYFVLTSDFSIFKCQFKLIVNHVVCFKENCLTDFPMHWYAEPRNVHSLCLIRLFLSIYCHSLLFGSISVIIEKNLTCFLLTYIFRFRYHFSNSICCNCLLFCRLAIVFSLFFFIHFIHLLFTTFVHVTFPWNVF